jgi:hypothetical protein
MANHGAGAAEAALKMTGDEWRGMGGESSGKFRLSPSIFRLEFKTWGKV